MKGKCFIILLSILSINIINSQERKSIIDYYNYEILNGIIGLDSHYEMDGIIKIFGTPNNIDIIPASFYYEGGKIIEIHEYIYDDLIHRYYVSENREVLYQGFRIESKLDRLQMINIGDSSRALKLTFIEKYYTYEDKKFHSLPNYELFKENIAFYINRCSIEFIVKNSIIQMITVNFLLH